MRALGELGRTLVSFEFIRSIIDKGSEHLIRSTLVETGAPLSLYDCMSQAVQDALAASAPFPSRLGTPPD